MTPAAPFIHARQWLLVAMLSAFAILPAVAQAEEEKQVAPQIKYKTEFTGAPEELKDKLGQYTDAVTLADDPPPSLYLLAQRLRQDSVSLTKALQAAGYYDATVTDRIDRETDPVTARFEITPGERYRLVSIRMVEEPESVTKGITLPDIEGFKLKVPSPLQYSSVLETRREVREKTFDANCLRTVEVRAHLRVDREAKTAEAIYFILAGHTAHFGMNIIEGLQSVNPAYVKRRINWKDGDCYNPKVTEKTHLTLLQTNLFSRADITAAETPDEEGKVPVTLTMRERAQRTIKAGIGFASDEGLDFKPSWEHRNLFGEGEKLNVEATISTFLQELKTTLEKPDFLRNDQKLILKGNLSRSETDAYTSTKIGGSGVVERRLTPSLIVGTGLGYTISEVDDFTTGENIYSLLSVPSYIEHTTRDDALDPTRGHQLRLDVTPLIETLNNGNVFLKSEGTAKFYHQHKDLPTKPVWALRATVGSIMGSATDDIPADERFFAGGGGSVRGYGYQLLGPLNAAGEPLGGRSMTEFSAELRLRVSESIGVVPFMDAGNVYSDIYPEFGDLYYAAGLGLRYFSDFGPFRFDFAVPLDKRDGVDDSYQFYLSFGQSF